MRINTNSCMTFCTKVRGKQFKSMDWMSVVYLEVGHSTTFACLTTPVLGAWCGGGRAVGEYWGGHNCQLSQGRALAGSATGFPSPSFQSCPLPAWSGTSLNLGEPLMKALSMQDRICNMPSWQSKEMCYCPPKKLFGSWAYSYRFYRFNSLFTVLL